MSRGAAFLASLLATISRPAWWAFALAAFLIRGGFVLFVLAIVVLPSPLALSNIVAPFIVPVAFGTVDRTVVLLAAAAGAVFLLWLIGGGWLAAAMEAILIRDAEEAAIEEGIGPPRRPAAPRPGDAARILAARLIAHIPSAVMLGLGAVQIVAVTYAELTRPLDVVTPLALRVMVSTAGPLALVVAAWFLGELVGGIAARRIILEGRSIGAALVAGVVDLVRRPLSTIVPAVASSMFLYGFLAGLLVATGTAWLSLRLVLAQPNADSETLAVALATFVAVWLAALGLTGLLAAFRGALMTFEEVRRHRSRAVGSDAAGDEHGTFGASTHRRPGDWSVPDEGGSL